MRELLLRDLERQIQRQRRKIANDKRCIQQSITDVPRKALRALTSPPGLLVSFAIGAVAAGLSRSRAVRSIALWDLFMHVAVQAPIVLRLVRELRSGLRARQS